MYMYLEYVTLLQAISAYIEVNIHINTVALFLIFLILRNLMTFYFVIHGPDS